MPVALIGTQDRQIGAIQKHFSLYIMYYRRTKCNRCLSSVFIYFWRQLIFLLRKGYVVHIHSNVCMSGHMHVVMLKEMLGLLLDNSLFQS